MSIQAAVKGGVIDYREHVGAYYGGVKVLLNVDD